MGRDIMKDQEVFKAIPGYEGLYEVSNLGRVRSLDRVVNSTLGRSYIKKGRILSDSGSASGYLVVGLSKDGKRNTRNVHRLVAEQFVDGFSDDLTVNHKNGIKTDNYYHNLEWVTQKENLKHAVDTGLSRNKPGLNNPSCKGLVTATNIETGEVVRLEGKKHMESIGFCSRRVSECVNGKRESYKGYRFFRITGVN
jgi:hypothetical protein